jgi:hypothetical protein
MRRNMGWMAVVGGLVVALAGRGAAAEGPIRVGIIGLDTSHAVAFTKLLNDPQAPPALAGCPVVAAYPCGSADIESSVSRVPGYTAEMRKLGVEIVDSIPALLERVDAVLLETNDGRPHLEQVRPVLAAGKPVFIDKPVAASLADAVTIYREALIAGVPVFSSSSLRFSRDTQAVRGGSIGRVVSCETTGPAHREPHHPDLFWYGIHGVESLFTVLGTGCESVARTSADGRIVVTGSWSQGRSGIYREDKAYGGTARGEQGEAAVGSSEGYGPLVEQIVKFFKTGVPPVTAAETLEILAFMEAADESERLGGAPVSIASTMRKAAGFTPLFNGTDLAGWKGLVGDPKSRAAMPAADLAAAQEKADAEMRAHWSVADGGLRFDGQGKNLCTAADYGDFELFVDWKIHPGGDSGLYLRGTPQVQIWDTTFPKYFPLGAEKGSGAFWNNKLHPRFPAAKADRPVGEWNTFFIRMVGERATVVLNGETVVDDVVMENYWDRTRPVDPRGQIELQNHGNELFFRDLFVREIPAAEANALLAARGGAEPGFAPLCNGRDLAGWKGAVDSYEVVDGAIVCKAGQGGTLFTEREYGDFVARLEFKLPPGGNNGLAIRYAGAGEPHIDGLELQVLDTEHEKYAKIDPRQAHGSIYGLVPAARGYLRPAGEWNFQEVTVRGNRYRVELNGFTIVDVDLDTVKESMQGPLPPGVARRRGHFGFCGHKDPVAFRRIMIRELPGEPAVPPDRGSARTPVGGPVRLFDGEHLEHFYVWNRGTAYEDPQRVFTVADGMLRVSGEGYGGLITRDDWRDYRLVMEFRWGEKTWGDRSGLARDSGLLVHGWGPDGGYKDKWPASIEAQIIEGGVGDLLVLQGIDPLTGRIYPTSLVAEATDGNGGAVWKRGAARRTVTHGRVDWFGRDAEWRDVRGFRGRHDVESPAGEWTRMDVIADGDRLTYEVNGVVVNEALDCHPSAGRIVLQTEQAELFVRRLELWPLGARPDQAAGSSRLTAP